MTTVLSGKVLAAQIKKDIAERVQALTARGVQVGLAIVTATDDEASAWYVRSITKAAAAVGIAGRVEELGVTATESDIRSMLVKLGDDPGVHGIILQTPLPDGVRSERVSVAIAPEKDVDGANPESFGRLATGLRAFAPATAQAVVELLDHHGIDLHGKHAVVVGRSTVVGKPLAHLLLDRHSTVTIAHSRTHGLAEVTSRGDVVVAAVGRARLITADHVGPVAVVVDVGTNPTPGGGLVGDVDPGVTGKAAALSPVPGGVGPVTTALLLRHTVDVAERAGAAVGS
ncbi:bifunctional 5,10-methylenetetrahydrofolate dehydrogenase/5,10-methenyltetrahydrofolate cyclohydrolase [Actinoalloteichus caeruleus]|uniref:bifunctional 5,10-methylenetetrahydrofolate dehydrogenase/5,10-methenyltetrahydrofolate cyclohydrolase n=1 Tax=Actinoalloteichus cyanogriseus TaxID=2893586 RepID=UPI000478EC2E|nr:bifunctional 5,10-methylenetetrahydrofolate dehydrogenase/5,10-methenyltetrahydrofolate cyclohydrolase [Actinoalloteichus caeruleus]